MPEWQEKDQLLRSAKGIGPIASIALLTELPELGSLSYEHTVASSTAMVYIASSRRMLKHAAKSI